MLCIDINGNTVPRRITADTANRSQTTTTDNFGAAFPPCDSSPIDQLRYEWCLFIGALGVAAVVQTMGTLYSAFLPLQHGDETRLDLENLTYEERLLVVATLWLVSVDFLPDASQMPGVAERRIPDRFQPFQGSRRYVLCPRATRQAMYVKCIALSMRKNQVANVLTLHM